MSEDTIIDQFNSKSGRQVVVRPLQQHDTAVLMEFMNEVSAEDTFLLVSGEEISHAQENQYVFNVLQHSAAGNMVKLLAFIDDVLVGTVDVRRMTENRKRSLHVGEVGLIVRKNYRGDGIGDRLMQLIIQEAKKLPNMRILRLWVFEPNYLAKRLYHRHGFELCGGVPEGIWYRDRYVKHELMCRKLVASS